MRDTLSRAGDAQVQLEQAVKGDEEPGRHRDRREQQHDAPLRKRHPEGQQQAEHAARRAHRGDGPRVDVADDHQLGDRRADDAHQVVGDEAAGAEQPLDLAAEHVQREHVEEQVGESTVQEAVREQLPHLEPWRARKLRRGRRPEREPAQQERAHDVLQGENRHVQDQQGPGDRGHR